MKAWLVDAYRKNDRIVLWVKTPDEDLRIVKSFSCFVYLEATIDAKKFLDKNKVQYIPLRKLTYLKQWKKVYAITVPKLNQFEQFIKWIEKETKHRVMLYNADVTPEQQYIYKNNLKPCGPIEIIDDKIFPIEGDPVLLKKMELEIVLSGYEENAPIKKIVLNDKILKGEEEILLKKFVKIFKQENPDVLFIEYAFSRLPYLVRRLNKYNLKCDFHRWDSIPIKYRGGRTFYSYGNVKYQDYAIRLNGRFLVDKSTSVGQECDVESIVELVLLSGMFFQVVGSRSFGSVFQMALVRNLIQDNLLVPFKEKPIDRPFNMFELLKSDRAGHTFDPKVGFHRDVAEIDFSSMYPWLIYNYNISADTIIQQKGQNVPGTPVKISYDHKGYGPRSIKPIIDRRMEYKKNPTAINKLKSIGLKWVLVSSYGYLRYREFKLGLASAHMAICAYARETLIQAANLAEEKGYKVVHGIIDSLYIKKKNIKEDEVKEFCTELEMITGIPVSFEGIFKWVVFLPSVLNNRKPVPTKYYGVFKHGELKTRGIEMRQRNSPFIIKYFQEEVLKVLSECETKKEIVEKVPILFKILKRAIKKIPKLNEKWLRTSARITTINYKHNIPQKKAVELLKKKGVNVQPGHTVKYIFGEKDIVLPEDYDGKPNVEEYKKLLIKSMFVVLQPFGFTKDDIVEFAGQERQTKVMEFGPMVKFVYVPLLKNYENKKGLSERLIKNRLIKQGWEVWRGGCINILKMTELYPNVQRKYEKLMDLLVKYRPKSIEMLQYLSAVHHGMPDYLCFRRGEFKFVECKLGYEQLSRRQKRCIEKLQRLGFKVEIHKMAEPQTKTREVLVNLINGKKQILDQQLILTKNHY